MARRRSRARPRDLPQHAESRSRRAAQVPRVDLKAAAFSSFPHLTLRAVLSRRERTKCEPPPFWGVTRLERKNLPGVEDVQRIERLLHLAHHAHRLAVLGDEKLLLAEPYSV